MYSRFRDISHNSPSGGFMNVTSDYSAELEKAKEEIRNLRQEVSMVKSAYIELLNDERRKMLLLDDVPMGEIVLDADSQLVDVNKGFETFLGYSREEFLSMRFHDLLAEGIDMHEAIFPVFKRTGIAKNLTWKMKRKNGDVITVVLYGKAVYDADGNFVQARGIILNITDKVIADEALKRSEREKALILDVMSDCIIFYNVNMQVIWANRVASVLSGIPAEEIKGKFCYEICHKEKGFCKGCPVGRPQSSKIPLSGEVRAAGMVFFIQTHPVFDEFGKFTGLVQVISDITERKEMERQILELASSERRKIGNDLHDGLGQVLTGISFISTVLYQELKDKYPEAANTAEDIVENTKKAQTTMRNIINGLCPVSEDSAGLMSTLESMATAIEKLYGIKCRYKCLHPVYVDDYELSNHLYFIAREAVNNAVKHSRCSNIKLCLKMKSGFLRLEVSDDGIGLKPDLITSGQGLRIMKYRASIIGADIEVNSKADRGTSISVIIKLTP